MREGQTGRAAQGSVGQLHGETTEQQEELGVRQAIGGSAEEARVNDWANESRHCVRVDAMSRSSLRGAATQITDSPTMTNEEGLVDGATEQQTGWAASSEDCLSPTTMEKWALDKAPPPIKLRREGETLKEASPKELSPPPSPKRMRELARKASTHELPFSKVFSQSSV